jgi:hypothetical protein
MVEELTKRITEIAGRLRKCTKALADSERAQQTAASAVRAHANGPQARKVEEAEDPHVVDLILRLRADEQLPAEAERIAGHLEQRAASLQDDLDLWVPESGSRYAACEYSPMRPPRRSRRTTRRLVTAVGGGAGPSGDACPNERCGRCEL